LSTSINNSQSELWTNENQLSNIHCFFIFSSSCFCHHFCLGHFEAILLCAFPLLHLLPFQSAYYGAQPQKKNITKKTHINCLKYSISETLFLKGNYAVQSLFCVANPPLEPCAFVFNSSGEKSIHGALDNIVYHIRCVYLCSRHKQEITGYGAHLCCGSEALIL